MTLRCATPDDHHALLELAVAFYAEDGFATPRAELAANPQRGLPELAAHTNVMLWAPAVLPFGNDRTGAAIVPPPPRLDR
jgi:hypothetical protein